MRLALSFALGILLSAAGCAALLPKQSAEDRVHAATMLLEFTGGGTCSGTMIAPDVLLSAAHCFDDGSTLLVVGGMPVNVLSIQRDGADHAWVTLDTNFQHYVTVGETPEQGDEIFIYGNPNAERDLLRRGYVVGTSRQGYLYLDARISHGDSGAGVFNENGELVGVISGGDMFSMMVLTVIYPIGTPE
jgi:hypothetical protein